MARTGNLWKTGVGGTYIQTIGPAGYDLLINGTDKYLNFNSLVGSSGYGFRDNAGVMEYKNSGGAWTSFAAGGGSPGGSDTQLQYNNAGSFGGISGATTNGTTVTFTTGNLVAHDVKASQSAGMDILSNAGTVCALFGAGGGANSTFYGGMKGDYLTASEILITDASKNIVSAAVATYPNLTELSYVKGVTSAIQTQIDALSNAVVLKGTWDASAGTFPGGGVAQAGWSYIVSVAGTVDGVSFNINDRLLAIVDNASTTTYASNWFKLDYTDQVLSVFGRTGTVIAVDGDYSQSLITGLKTTDSPTFSGLALGSGSITLTGSIASTGSRVTKGWFTDIESTNMPTVGGTAILTSITAPQFTTIELGHASDTTLSRVSSGVIAVEGVTIPTISSTNTITNKRNQPRIVSASSYTTDTGTSLDVSTCDEFIITAQAGALLFNNPSGTPAQGEKLIIRIKDNGTARALTYGSQFRASSDLALPTTTVLSKTLYMGFIYNSTDTKWDLIAVLNNFT